MKAIELYRFSEAAETPVIHTLVRGERDVVYNSETYVGGYSIDRGQVETTGDLSRQSLELTMSRVNPVAARYLAAPLDVVVSLTVFVQIAGTGTFTLWRGRLTSVKATDQSVSLVFESVFTSLARPGLRARYSRSCRHTHYGRGCNLNRDDWAVPVTVTNIDGFTVLVSGIEAEALNRFRGGMIKELEGNVVRFVSASSTTSITLNRRFETLEQQLVDAGAPISAILYPGCPHNMAGCIEFDNLDNYGGFPWLPTKNPIGSSIV